MKKTPKIIVPANETVFDDGIVCMFDGQKRKMMHRHVLANYGMTWDEYKAYCRLPADYPAVAPGYSREKSAEAVRLGFGSRSETVAVDLPRGLVERIAPLALNEGMTKDEFVAHTLIEHLLSLGKPEDE
ncbi:hypothetical protein G6L37_05905 [Agrobacterium rubi]|nr:hypothetical protein [Agrobacterium rubi]NTF24894.1 hypothetical protein [Agrobacterium rubi]